MSKMFITKYKDIDIYFETKSGKFTADIVNNNEDFNKLKESIDWQLKKLKPQKQIVVWCGGQKKTVYGLHGNGNLLAKTVEGKTEQIFNHTRIEANSPKNAELRIEINKLEEQINGLYSQKIALRNQIQEVSFAELAKEFE